MNFTLLIDTSSTATSGGYTIGALIALLILVYLVYALIKPEKF